MRLAVAYYTRFGHEPELAGKGARVEFSTHVVTRGVSDEMLHAAGQELAKRIAFHLSGLERGLPLEGVAPRARPGTPVEEAPHTH